ncbi:thyroid peroxidase-like isoform X3 [Tachypleus tridentatus]|uniref:thyroid peroxidase-like isoform X3 n=1 Tax=Tachypleus tridentatus TaxID=6853 RepID=UPI003FD36C76
MQFAQFVDHDLTFTPMNQAVNLNTGQANCISSVRSLPGQLKLGDTCASEQPGLTVLHTVFLREHNRIVENLPRLNQHWSDEDLYNSGNSLDQIMQVLVATSMETLDNTITQEVTNHLFEDSHTPFSGLDLAILNLQRGRIMDYNHIPIT